MPLISIDLNQARQTAGTFSSSGNTLDDVCGHLQQQWSSLSSTWEGDSKYDVTTDVNAVLNRGRHCAEFARERGAKLTQIADRFEGADESVACVVQAMVWGGVTAISVAAPAVNLPPAVVPPDPRNDVFKEIQELDGIKNWNNLSQDERASVLVEAHQLMMKAYNCPYAPVYGRDLNDGFFADLYIWRPLNGQMSPGDGQWPVDDGKMCIIPPNGVRVEIDEALLGRSDPNKALNTLGHESRHAIQLYAVQHPEASIPGVNEEMRQQWIENFKNYKDAKTYGYKTYQSQPIESDAFGFGDQMEAEI